MRLPWLCALAFAFAISSSAKAETPRDPAPFKRFTTIDSLHREVTYYVSTSSDAERAAPLALFVQGSGCDSQFRMGDGAIAGRMQALLLDAAKGRARVMVVEKPGVKFLDESQQMGVAEGCSTEFLREHTLPRWAEAVGAALRSAVKLPKVDARRVLVVGWSEGGVVAARVAAENPQVTHVASLAGGGPSQLFDFLAGAGPPGADVFTAFAAMQKDPDSATKLWMGHPYRRWTSFFASSVRDEMMRTSARLFIAHGSDDQSVPVVSFDVLRAELLAHGKPVTAERLDGVGHLFCKNDARSPDGMHALFGRVIDWFLR